MNNLIIHNSSNLYRSSSYSPFNSFSVGNLIGNILITVLVYTVPIAVYRYGIRKSPVSPSTGKVITIIYAIVAMFVMTIIKQTIGGGGTIGGAILLWSFINYSILTSDSSQKEEENNQSGNVQNQTDDDTANYEDNKADNIEADDYYLVDFDQVQNMSMEVKLPAIDDRYNPIVFYIDDKTTNYDPVFNTCFCKKCGVSIDSDSMYCRKCGAKVQ